MDKRQLLRLLEGQKIAEVNKKMRTTHQDPSPFLRFHQHYHLLRPSIIFLYHSHLDVSLQSRCPRLDREANLSELKNK